MSTPSSADAREEPVQARWGERVAAVAVALAATLPWLAKPLHIDDAADLQYVRQVLRAPLDPYGFEVDWDEGPRPAFRNYHPPLKYYYHALVLAVLPLSEVTLHLANLPLVALTAWAVLSLGRRFGCPPFALLVLWMLGPGYLPGQNAMLDVPAIALGLAATALFVRGVDDDRPWRLAWAGLVLGAALLTKYSTLVYLPVWAGYLVAHGRWRHALAPAVSLALFAAWCGVSAILYGAVHARVLFERVPGHELAWFGLDRIIPALVFLGGAMPAALVWIVGGGRRAWLVLVFAALVAVVAATLFPPERRVIREPAEFTRVNFAWWCLLVACGSRLVFHAATAWRGAPSTSASEPAATGGVRDRDAIFLAWWFAVALVLGAWGSPFLAMRRVVEASLPAWMLLVRVPGAPGTGRLGRAACAAGVVLNTLVGFAVAAADYEFASVYPRFARELSETVQANPSRVWCHGYWGWSHYTRREGLQHYVIGRDLPRPGSLFVVPNIAAKPANLPDDVRVGQRQVYDRAIGGRIPIRLMSHRAGAGYYSAAWGPLPYAWSWAPLEVFQFFELGGGRVISTAALGEEICVDAILFPQSPNAVVLGGGQHRTTCRFFISDYAAADSIQPTCAAHAVDDIKSGPSHDFSKKCVRFCRQFLFYQYGG